MDKRLLAENLADLRHLNTWVTKAFESVLGISLIRYEIMNVLVGKGEMTQNDIQREMDVDRAAITRHLQTLEEKGYIQREKDPKDSRCIQVSLTSVGKHVMTSCNTDHETMVRELVEGVSEEQMETMSIVLKQMKKNVEAIIGKKDLDNEF